MLFLSSDGEVLSHYFYYACECQKLAKDVKFYLTEIANFVLYALLMSGWSDLKG